MYDFYLNREEEKEMKNYQEFQLKYAFDDKITRVFELTPIDSAKSFNWRCKVLESNKKYYLLSYNTIVCCWDKEQSVFVKLWDDYSVTTMRHINSFTHFIGLPSCRGKHWWNALSYGVEYTVSELLNIV